MKITVTDFGDQGIKKFQHATCSYCRDNIPVFLDDAGVPTDSDTEKTQVFLMKNFDRLNMSKTNFCLLGCLWSPFEDVQSGPNCHQYLDKPSEHVNKSHKDEDGSRSWYKLKENSLLIDQSQQQENRNHLQPHR